mgnify:CR=1 FL=1
MRSCNRGKGNVDSLHFRVGHHAWTSSVMPPPSTTAPLFFFYFAAAVRRDVLLCDMLWRRDFAPFANCSTRRFRPRPTDAGRGAGRGADAIAAIRHARDVVLVGRAVAVLVDPVAVLVGAGPRARRAVVDERAAEAHRPAIRRTHALAAGHGTRRQIGLPIVLQLRSRAVRSVRTPVGPASLGRFRSGRARAQA